MSARGGRLPRRASHQRAGPADRPQRRLLEAHIVGSEDCQPVATSEDPILIVGCPRSGTTLLRDLLRSHPRLTFPHESRVIPALYRAYGDPADAAEARRIAAALLGSWDIALWRTALRPEDLEDHRSFATLVRQLYDTWAAREDKPRWGDKTPLYVLELDTMWELFPSAQVIHIVRDGRDVALSLQRQPWGPTNAYTSGLMWRRAVAAGLDAASRSTGKNLLHVRYERLLQDPESQLRTICAYLREEFDPAVLVPSRLADPTGRPHRWQAGRRATIDRSVSGRWPAEMRYRDRVVFETVAGPELERTGYPRSAPTRRLPVLERLGWRTRDVGSWVHWRLTTWDRRPRAQTTLILICAWLSELRRRGPSAARHRLSHYA